MIYLYSVNLSPTTFQTVFFSSDTDRSGTISMDEFIKVIIRSGVYFLVSNRIADFSNQV